MGDQKSCTSGDGAEVKSPYTSIPLKDSGLLRRQAQSYDMHVYTLSRGAENNLQYVEDAIQGL